MQLINPLNNFTLISVHSVCFVVVNKLIIDTRTKFYIYARRAFRLQKTHQWRSNSKKLKKSQIKYEVEEHWDPKFLKVLQNTAKVIYAWGLSIKKNSKFCKQLIYKYNYINDNSCQLKKCWLLGLWYPRGNKSPPAVASTQWL